MLTPVRPVARAKIENENSYDAFHHRRLIARFLAGDLKDVMDDKGKTMFPKNCECVLPQRRQTPFTRGPIDAQRGKSSCRG